MSFAKSIDFLFNQMRNASIGSLASGWVFFYSAGTTNAKPVYLDRLMAQQAANPYQLSADGTATLFGDGVYRVVVKTNLNNAPGVTVYDYDNVQIIDINTITSTDVTTIESDATAGPLSITFTAGTPAIIFIKTDDTINEVTITAPLGYTFNGLDTYVLRNLGESVSFRLIGTTYYVV